MIPGHLFTFRIQLKKLQLGICAVRRFVPFVVVQLSCFHEKYMPLLFFGDF